MSDIRLAALMRYPVKGLSAESLERVAVVAGEPLPGDRAFAIENGPSGFDPAAPRHFPKIRFLTLMKNAVLADLRTQFDPDRRYLVIRRSGSVIAEGALDDPAGREAITSALTVVLGPEARGPLRLLEAPGFSFSDVAAKVVHIINLASVRDLERWVGRPVDPLRFRANLHIDGAPAWSELDWGEATLTCGDVVLRVVKRTERCAATNVDPVTAERDMEIPRTLMGVFGHTDCGIYAEVIRGGTLMVGQRLSLSPAAKPERLPF
jgi:hypothetical protein